MISKPSQILSDRLGFDPKGEGTLRLFTQEGSPFRVVPKVQIKQVDFVSPTLLKITTSLKRYTGNYHTDTGRLYVIDRQESAKTIRATIKFESGIVGETPTGGA